MNLSQQQQLDYMKMAYQRLDKAYAPYSKFPVSAILLLKNGKIFTGVNIENVSFGATVCAERVALLSAINEGYRKDDFAALFVVAKTQQAISPCCLCRQVFVEFLNQDMTVYLANRELDITLFIVSDLVPYAFDSLT